MSRLSASARNDLTQGNITAQIISFFLPIAAGTIFQQLYNAVDGIVVGKFVGTEALAAVGGSAAVIINVLIGFFVASTSGAAVVISHLYGARDYDGIAAASGTSFFLCIIFSIFLMGTGIPLSPLFLRLLDTPDDTMVGSVTYLRIYFAGVFFSLIYNMGAGILRATGDSKRPFYYQLVGCITNIVLDLVLVIAFDMGVAGVAVATVISQLLSAILVIIRMQQPGEPYRLIIKNLKPAKKHLRSMLRIGIPAGLQNSMYSVSNMFLQICINSIGTSAVAGWALSGKIDGIFWAAESAAGTTVMNFSGQNYGAKQYDRIKEGNRKSLLLFCGMAVLLSAVIYFAGVPLLNIFSDDAEVIDLAYKTICYFAPFYWLWSVNEILLGTFRGAGDALVPTIISGICICLFRILWSFFVFPHIPSLLGISLSYPISWIIAMVIIIIRYKRETWLKRV